MATPLSTDARKQMQYDVLWNVMSDNELLPFSAISGLNQQLNTDNKNVIKAVNELLSKLSINNTTVNNFNGVFNTYVGNPDLDTTDWDNLKTIDTNVIKSVYKTYTQLNTLSGKVVETYTTAEKTKLTGIADSATNASTSTTNGNIKINGVESVVYTHPANHPASIITQDANNRFVTDAEKTTWNSKANMSDIPSIINKTTLDKIGENGTRLTFNGNDVALLSDASGSGASINDTTPSDSTTYSSNKVESLLSGKANTVHTHTISDVSGLQSALDGKANVIHSHTLADITDVDVTNKTNGYVLTYDNTTSKFVSMALPSGSGSGATNMAGLSDVDVTTTAPTEGDVLTFTGGIWKPGIITSNIDGGTF